MTKSQGKMRVKMRCFPSAIPRVRSAIPKVHYSDAIHLSSGVVLKINLGGPVSTGPFQGLTGSNKN